MPEHAHLILWPRHREYDIASILSSIKNPVTRKSRWVVTHEAPEFIPRMLDIAPNGKQSIRFWQRGGGYDRNLFTAREIWEKIDYIHRNPVRRGLAEDSIAWAWSSAADYAGLARGPLPLDIEDLPPRP